MTIEEAIEILSDMRAEYNLFGDEEEATRYHVLSWAIQEMKAAQQWVPCNERPLQACGHATELFRESIPLMNYCPICGQRIDWEGEADDEVHRADVRDGRRE